MKTRKHLIASVILVLSIATVYAQEHAILVDHRKLKNRHHLNLLDQNSRIIGEMSFDKDASPIPIGTKKVPAVNIVIPGYEPATIAYLKRGGTIVNLEKEIIATYGLATSIHDVFSGMKHLLIYDLEGNLLSLNEPLFYDVHHFAFSDQGALYLVGSIRGRKTYSIAKYNLAGELEWVRDIPVLEVKDFKISEANQSIFIIQGSSVYEGMPKVDFWRVEQFDFEGNSISTFKKKYRLSPILAIHAGAILYLDRSESGFCIYNERGKKKYCIENIPPTKAFKTENKKISEYFSLITLENQLLILRVRKDSVELVKSFDLNQIGDFDYELGIKNFSHNAEMEFEILLSTYDLIILR